MEPRPLTLTLALALLLTADSPLLALSLVLALFPPPPPPPPPPPLPSPSPSPQPSSSPRPPGSRPFHQHMPPLSSPRPSAQPTDVQGASGRPPPLPPPVSCPIASNSACGRHQSPSGWSGGGSSHWVSDLNLGKKVGLAFAAAFVVLQIVFGGFLFYKRRQIGMAGYHRDLASAAPSELPSAS